MSLTVKFCGAARTVTGSCFYFDTGKAKFIVDCGMFQGPKTLKELNYGDFPFDPRALDFMLLTHAHIDHSGLIPKLVKAGFEGPIHATRGTIDLCSYMLPDSGHIQEMEVENLNRRNARRNRAMVTPIYTSEDATNSLQAFRPVGYENWIEPAPGIRARYWNAGHILGSASIELEIGEEGKTPPVRLLLSGDIGPEAKLLQPDPAGPSHLDYVFCESTYGHAHRPILSPEKRREILAAEVREAAAKKGALVIPAFAVERTQELLADLILLMESGQVPAAPVFLDSPLAIRVSKVFLQHADEMEEGAVLKRAMNSPHLRFTESVDESKAIERISDFHVIVAASGMCDAGRIRHHLRHWLWNRNATVLLPGYQAVGTLGRLLEDGAAAVRIQGEEIRVRATIRKMEEYSGHADSDALIRWLEARQPIGKGLFLVHGEAASMDEFAPRLSGKIIAEKALLTPVLDDVYDLSGAAPKLVSPKGPRRIAPAAVGKLDWYNDLSKLILDIGDRLDKEAGEKQRAVVIRRLRHALEKDKE